MSESRVLKFNETNLAKQGELLEQHSAIAAKNKKGKNKKLNFFLCGKYFNSSIHSVTGTKPKKPDANASSKDSDSRASTPSKELAQIEKSATNLNTSNTSSRGRAPKQSTSVSNTPNPEQNTSREIKRGASERDSRDEIPK